MKNQTNLLTTSLLIVAGVFAILAFKPSEKAATVYEYKQFSTVESLVAGGLGRSRILTTDEKGVSVEKDLMNFFSMVGINFGNISNNDKLIVDRINEYSNEGWDWLRLLLVFKAHLKTQQAYLLPAICSEE